MSLPGGSILTETLRTLGIPFAVGLPGTQNVVLFEALRQASFPTIVPSHELAASFIAAGYARRSGRPALLVTIPGPGFTYAMTGIAEARLDSLPLLHLMVREPDQTHRALQYLPLEELARPLYKEVCAVTSLTTLASTLRRAYQVAASDEPGPVLLDISSGIFAEHLGESQSSECTDPMPIGLPDVRNDIVRRLRSSQKPVLMVGQGASAVAGPLLDLARLLPAPVVSTISGRGILPDSHPLCFSIDFSLLPSGEIQELLDQSDCILAIGTKLGHNGTGGYALQLDPAKLIHADSAEASLNSFYESRCCIVARSETLVPYLLQELGKSGTVATGQRWNMSQLAAKKAALHEARAQLAEQLPHIAGVSASRFFELFNEAAGSNRVIVLDSGFHQSMARTYLQMHTPRSLILPSDFQSMGYALPAALGAALADRNASLAVIVGDGGFQMQAQELITLRREGIAAPIFVFCDKSYGLIRQQQLEQFGESYGCTLTSFDLKKLAEAYGIAYDHLASVNSTSFHTIFRNNELSLIEVPVTPQYDLEQKLTNRHRQKRQLRRLLGEENITFVKKGLQRFR